MAGAHDIRTAAKKTALRTAETDRSGAAGNARIAGTITGIITGRNAGKAAAFRQMAALLLTMLALLVCGGFPAQAAVSAGTYTVTVTPSYTDPETGNIEDPGNNEAIGQGMTQKLCGPVGLLEVDASGQTYLTVRYYLSQFVSDVGFEERSGGSYTTLRAEKMQTKAPVSGSSNIDEKYGFTDWRMKISSADDVFRGKAYIQPMGRNVVYFFTVSNPVSGSGDFVTAAGAQAQQGNAVQGTGTAQADRQQSAAAQTGTAANSAEEAPLPEVPDYLLEGGENTSAESHISGTDNAQSGSVQTAGSTAATVSGKSDGDGIVEQELRSGADRQGTGSIDAPVTGIPEKPGSAGAKKADGSDSAYAQDSARESDTQSSSAETYHLDTPYDLESVPLEKARKLTEPLLADATGVTNLNDEEISAVAADRQADADGAQTQNAADSRTRGAKTGSTGTRSSVNKLVMYVLLAASAVLAVFAFAMSKHGGSRELPETDNAPEDDFPLEAGNVPEDDFPLEADNMAEDQFLPEANNTLGEQFPAEADNTADSAAEQETAGMGRSTGKEAHNAEADEQI